MVRTDVNKMAIFTGITQLYKIHLFASIEGIHSYSTWGLYMGNSLETNLAEIKKDHGININ